MRQPGLKPYFCIRAVNAFVKWSGSPLKFPKVLPDEGERLGQSERKCQTSPRVSHS